MLVLSRQRDETIMIGDEVEITIVDIRGDKVRLGITAPARIAVHRKEVYEAIKAENHQAANVAGADLESLSTKRRATPARPGAPGAGGLKNRAPLPPGLISSAPPRDDAKRRRA